MIPDMLRGFLDAEGRVTQFPARRKKQLAVLQYLAGKFAPGLAVKQQAGSTRVHCERSRSTQSRVGRGHCPPHAQGFSVG